MNESYHTVGVCGYQYIVLSLPPFHLSGFQCRQIPLGVVRIPTPFLAKIPENVLVPSPSNTQGRFSGLCSFL